MMHHRKCVTLKMLHLQSHLRHFSYKSYEVPWKSSISFPVPSVMVPLCTLILPSRCLQFLYFLSYSLGLTNLFFKFTWHIVSCMYSLRFLLEASSLRRLNFILLVWGNLFKLVLSQFCLVNWCFIIFAHASRGDLHWIHFYGVENK